MTRTETEDLLRRVYPAYDEADVTVIAELTGRSTSTRRPRIAFWTSALG